MAQDNQALLSRLRQHRVEFVVIGGVCSVYYGVPIATFDLDICCGFDETSLRRVEAAMRELHPVHRLVANPLPLELTSELCSRLENLYLHTDLGNLDCLSEVAGIGNYEEVLRQSIAGDLPYGTFRFLTLDALIAAKQAADRDRDRETLKYLLPIRERRARQAGPS
jgi:hypothetical protein